MARVGLDGNDVAFLQLQLVHVVVVAFAGVLELHLYEVGIVCVARHIGKPVVGVELSVLAANGLMAQSAVAADDYLMFFFHISILFLWAMWGCGQCGGWVSFLNQ